MGKFMAVAKFPVGGWMFQALLPAKPGKSADNPSFALEDLGKLQRAAARWLAENGAISKESVRFLRSMADLTQSATAQLLEVEVRTVARWEAGDSVIDRARFFALASLALEKVEGGETRSLLRAEPALRAKPAWSTGDVDLKVA